MQQVKKSATNRKSHKRSAIRISGTGKKSATNRKYPAANRKSRKRSATRISGAGKNSATNRKYPAANRKSPKRSAIRISGTGKKSATNRKYPAANRKSRKRSAIRISGAGKKQKSVQKIRRSSRNTKGKVFKRNSLKPNSSKSKRYTSKQIEQLLSLNIINTSDLQPKEPDNLYLCNQPQNVLLNSKNIDQLDGMCTECAWTILMIRSNIIYVDDEIYDYFKSRLLQPLNSERIRSMRNSDANTKEQELHKYFGITRKQLGKIINKQLRSYSVGNLSDAEYESLGIKLRDDLFDDYLNTGFSFTKDRFVKYISNKLANPLTYSRIRTLTNIDGRRKYTVSDYLKKNKDVNIISSVPVNFVDVNRIEKGTDFMLTQIKSYILENRSYYSSNREIFAYVDKDMYEGNMYARKHNYRSKRASSFMELFKEDPVTHIDTYPDEINIRTMGHYDKIVKFGGLPVVYNYVGGSNHSSLGNDNEGHFITTINGDDEAANLYSYVDSQNTKYMPTAMGLLYSSQLKLPTLSKDNWVNDRMGFAMRTPPFSYSLNVTLYCFLLFMNKNCIAGCLDDNQFSNPGEFLTFTFYEKHILDAIEKREYYKQHISTISKNISEEEYYNKQMTIPVKIKDLPTNFYGFVDILERYNINDITRAQDTNFSDFMITMDPDDPGKSIIRGDALKTIQDIWKKRLSPSMEKRLVGGTIAIKWGPHVGHAISFIKCDDGTFKYCNSHGRPCEDNLYVPIAKEDGRIDDFSFLFVPNDIADKISRANFSMNNILSLPNVFRELVGLSVVEGAAPKEDMFSSQNVSLASEYDDYKPSDFSSAESNDGGSNCTLQ
jgi:hypothetical protein